MNTLLMVTGSILLSVAAVLHIFFFYLESVAFSRPSSWKRFGVRSAEAAETIRPWAFNQGFYNLFIAVGTLAGVALLTVTSLVQAGIAAVLFGAMVMIGASLVLVMSDGRMAMAAAIQGGIPLVGSVAIVASLFV
jgi:putative membrane protein